MKVRDVMTKDPRMCRPLDPLSVPAGLMWDHDCGSIPVVSDEGEVVGMITDRDICMAAYTRNLPLDEMAVVTTMSTPVFPVGADDSIAAAEQIMRERQVRRLPVLGSDNQLVGIVSINDLARVAMEGPRDRTPGVSAAAIETTLAAIGKGRSPERGDRS